MVPIIMLAALAALGYGLFRLFRKWGLVAVCLLAATVNFIGASGVLAEYLWGPQWSWNFAHHDRGYGLSALFGSVFWLFLGLRFRAQRRNSH